MQQLKSGSFLQGGKYKIEKVLGQGGFGITYLATQELLDRKVCIKEFFFKEYCERDEATSHVSLGTQSNHEIVERFMNKFLKEARTISQLDHRNIIKIHDIFKENNTAYYVMDYVEGESLNEMVNRRGALPEKEAVSYIERVADALKYIHQHNINHLDIKPSNIMIRQRDYRVILIDFGLSKQYDAQGGQTSTTPVGISHGYAPMEQYKQGGVSTFSPQTDIYALGATLYKLVTGNTPPQAMDILDEGLPSLPSSLSSSIAETIKKAMQPRKVDRPNSIDDFLSELKNISQISSFVHQETVSQQKPNNDEETRILSNVNANTEIKRERIIKTTQPRIILDSHEDVNKKENIGGNIVGCALFLILGCFILLFVLRGAYSENTANSPADKSQATQAQEVTSHNVNQPQTTGYINGHEYVDLGLSVKWATCNVGASSLSDYGDYFAWGEISAKSSYNMDNSVTFRENFSNISGDSRYDAARANWGGSWRLPTETEVEELENKCTYKWSSLNGHWGCKVIGPNGNSIFLPAAGCRRGTSLEDVDYLCYYWTSTPQENYWSNTYTLYIKSSGFVDAVGGRYEGLSIRPVSD